MVPTLASGWTHIRTIYDISLFFAVIQGEKIAHIWFLGFYAAAQQVVQVTKCSEADPKLRMNGVQKEWRIAISQVKLGRYP